MCEMLPEKTIEVGPQWHLGINSPVLNSTCLTSQYQLMEMGVLTVYLTF